VREEWDTAGNTEKELGQIMVGGEGKTLPGLGGKQRTSRKGVWRNRRDQISPSRHKKKYNAESLKIVLGLVVFSQHKKKDGSKGAIKKKGTFLYLLVEGLKKGRTESSGRKGLRGECDKNTAIKEGGGGEIFLIFTPTQGMG